MAVRVIGSWYYTSELPAQEAANLRAAMVTKNCESLETWLKTSVHDADRKTRLYALLRHAAFESWLAGLELLIKYDADVNPPAGGGRATVVDGLIGADATHYAAASKAASGGGRRPALRRRDACRPPPCQAHVRPPLRRVPGRREEEAVKDRRYQVVVHLLGTAPGQTPKTPTTSQPKALQYRPIRCEKLLQPSASRAGPVNTAGRASSRFESSAPATALAHWAGRHAS